LLKVFTELLNYSEAVSFVSWLCDKIGIPRPMFDTLPDSSYVLGEYEDLRIRLKKKVDADTCVHEWMHYVFDLARKYDNALFEDNIEHRFVNFVSAYCFSGLLKRFKSERQKVKRGKR